MMRVTGGFGKRATIGVALVMSMSACSEPAPDGGAESTPAPTAVTSDPESQSDADPEDSASQTTDAPDSATEPATTTEPVSTTVEATVADDGSVVFDFAGASWFLGEVPASGIAADPDAEPIRIGMINQEDTPLGSFPEVRGAAQAAVAWINAELGGVGGRPIELVTCITSFSVEQSQACAQELVQQDVVAVLGGIDVTSNGSIPILQQNGLPVLGGIPANLAEQQSTTNFYFSGGTVGGMAAMLAHADVNGLESVMIAYGEFESFEVTARDYAAVVAESLGMRVELLPFPIVGADMLQVLTAAADAEVDALIVAAADTSCVPVMQGAEQLGLDTQIYLVGGCAAETILEAAGTAAAGVVFTQEGPADADDIEGSIFDAVTAAYATSPSGGTGTVGFRGMMNLYSLLLDLGPDGVDSAALTDLARAAVDRPSFWGHPYTCDGLQVPGLPALCAPQQTLFTTTGVPGEELVFLPDGFEETDGWVETDDLFKAALG